MQQCPTCGSQNPDNAEVCADCGMELPGHAATSGAPASDSVPAPQTPSATPLDFTPEPASTPSPAPASAPAAGNDPFAGNEWNFDLEKGTSASEPAPHSSPDAAITPESASGVVTPMPDLAPLPDSSVGAPAGTDAAGASAPTVVVEPSTAPPASTPMPTSGAAGTAKLILKRGGAPTGDVFTIGPNATVGRFDPESGPVDVDMANLPEAVYISRHHAEVLHRDGQWLVKDLGSRNGTFIKSASGFDRVTGESPVQNGDEIAFGNARFEFQSA